MIDAHDHPLAARRAWLHLVAPDLDAIHRYVELRALTAANGIDGAVLVQSQNNAADTDCLLSLAAIMRPGSPARRP